MPLGRPRNILPCIWLLTRFLLCLVQVLGTMLQVGHCAELGLGQY